MGKLRDRAGLITGAASGIGAATARLLVAEGARLVLVDRDADGLQKLEEELGDRVKTHVADVSIPAEAEAYTDAAVQAFGRIDLAIFNAGIVAPFCPLHEYELETFDRILSINLRAAWLGLRASARVMKKMGSPGSIVLTSSIQGLSAVGGATAYTTAKHGLVGMMKGAAMELAGSGIRVNTIHPGFIDTPLLQDMERRAAPDDPAGARAEFVKTVPMRRYAEPEEIARMMLFLVSDDSSYSTGATFVADGGILASWGPTDD